jgi:tRNA splicing endonuclease
LVAGKVAGFESYKVDKQNQLRSVQKDSFPVTDRLFEAFRQSVISNKENGLTADNIAADVEYSKTRLRQEIATANYSNEAGIQVLLETDPQIIKATESMAVARNLAEKNLAMRR